MEMVVETCSGGSLHLHFLSKVGWKGKVMGRTEERCEILIWENGSEQAMLELLK